MKRGLVGLSSWAPEPPSACIYSRHEWQQRLHHQRQLKVVAVIDERYKRCNPCKETFELPKMVRVAIAGGTGGLGRTLIDELSRGIEYIERNALQCDGPSPAN